MSLADQHYRPTGLVHEPTDGDPRSLAATVETADSYLSQARGLMFRRSIPEDYALVFRFDGQKTRRVHMVFVPFPLDVVWLRDGRVERVRTLSPWVGHGGAVADALIELPAGAAADVSEGDRIEVA